MKLFQSLQDVPGQSDRLSPPTDKCLLLFIFSSGFRYASTSTSEQLRTPYLTARQPLTHISINHLNGVASIFPPIIITISSVSLMSGSQPRFPPGELSNMNPKSVPKDNVPHKLGWLIERCQSWQKKGDADFIYSTNISTLTGKKLG